MTCLAVLPYMETGVCEYRRTLPRRKERENESEGVKDRQGSGGGGGRKRNRGGTEKQRKKETGGAGTEGVKERSAVKEA